MEVKELQSRAKQMSKRQVPAFKVTIEPEGDYSAIATQPGVGDGVMNELLKAISDGIKKRKKIITLFQITYTMYSVELARSQWAVSLDNARKYFEKTQEFSKCAECRDLIKKLS